MARRDAAGLVRELDYRGYGGFLPYGELVEKAEQPPVLLVVDEGVEGLVVRFLRLQGIQAAVTEGGILVLRALPARRRRPGSKEDGKPDRCIFPGFIVSTKWVPGLSKMLSSTRSLAETMLRLRPVYRGSLCMLRLTGEEPVLLYIPGTEPDDYIALIVRPSNDGYEAVAGAASGKPLDPGKARKKLEELAKNPGQRVVAYAGSYLGRKLKL